jgi:hypothetical protein
MLTRNGHILVRNLLFPILIIFTLAGSAAGQATSSLTPPPWSVGQWWIVECQVYDLGKVVRGAQPGWRAMQTWRFQVEKKEQLAGQPYFVVAVKPVKDNSCPYSFRVWYRVSDRFVGRQELIHPTPTPGKPKVIGPPAVSQDFLNDAAAPFFTEEFPNLPLTMPLFNVAQKSLSFQAAQEGPLSQTVEEVSPAVMDKANAAFRARMGANLSTQNVLIKVSAAGNVSESQYWNAGLPFPFYGERFDQTHTSRRYWLVDTGKN